MDGNYSGRAALAMLGEGEGETLLKVLIFGAAGSGCSTLGKALSRVVDIPCFDSDDYFWVATDPPFQKNRSPEEAFALFSADTEGIDSWILAGSQKIGALAADRLDLAVFLYVPPETRIPRLRARERSRFGDRIDPGGDIHEEHVAFIDWASKYENPETPVRNLKMHTDWMDSLQCRVLRIEGTPSVERSVQQVSEVIRSHPRNETNE